MKLLYCYCLTFFLIGIAQCLPSEKVLDLTSAPKLSKSDAAPRSVNLSFFVPAMSLFALMSQYFPQMFPGLTTTTTSRRHQRSLRSIPGDQNWVENFISNGLVY
ncbi:unnamed protein product [Allacma fusca]|uniref:Uncharacterized protein n=1 Tax=Allacma fusca TaxID=39272 RepID=A0A8J2PRC6_9HEXA|nr:unnamed protein product [Allacma fusca]